MQKKMWVLSILSVFILFSSGAFLPAESGQHLSGEHVAKIKWIADFISGELDGRNIDTVMVEEFTDFHGRPSPAGKAISDELEIQLKNITGKKFIVVTDSPGAVVTGVVLPYKDGSKFRLDVNLLSPDKSKTITSYTGVFKRLQREKK